MSNDARRITNTAEQASRNPGGTLAEMMLFGGSGAIVRQEAIGQSELVNSADLPVQGSEDPAWKTFGVTFGVPSSDDDLFRFATLPVGWKKVATDHAMWSDLVDEKGRKRAAIFYKAAFYDRSAYMSVVGRFGVARNYGLDYGADGKHINDGNERIQHQVTDGGNPVFSTDVVVLASASREDYAAQEATSKVQIEACEEWLAANGFPDWQNRAAYWD